MLFNTTRSQREFMLKLDVPYIFNPDYALGIVMRVESLIKQTLF